MTLANRRQWRKKSRARKRAGEWQKSLLKKKRKSSPTIREVGGHKTAPGCVRKMIDISQANGRALQRSESMAIRPVSNVPIGSHWSSDMADHWPPHCHWRIIGLILRGFSQCPTTCFQRIWLLGFFFSPFLSSSNGYRYVWTMSVSDVASDFELPHWILRVQSFGRSLATAVSLVDDLLSLPGFQDASSFLFSDFIQWFSLLDSLLTTFHSLEPFFGRLRTRFRVSTIHNSGLSQLRLFRLT